MSDVGTSERDRLQYFLDQQRNAVLAIIDGLDGSQLLLDGATGRGPR